MTARALGWAIPRNAYVVPGRSATRRHSPSGLVQNKAKFAALAIPGAACEADPAVIDQ